MFPTQPILKHSSLSGEQTRKVIKEVAELLQDRALKVHEPTSRARKPTSIKLVPIDKFPDALASGSYLAKDDGILVEPVIGRVKALLP